VLCPQHFDLLLPEELLSLLVHLCMLSFTQADVKTLYEVCKSAFYSIIRGKHFSLKLPATEFQALARADCSPAWLITKKMFCFTFTCAFEPQCLSYVCRNRLHPPVYKVLNANKHCQQARML